MFMSRREPGVNPRGAARQRADYLQQMLRPSRSAALIHGFNLVLELKAKTESEFRSGKENLKPEEAAVLALLRSRLAKEAESSRR
jgi:hypothetical protein